MYQTRARHDRLHDSALFAAAHAGQQIRSKHERYRVLKRHSPDCMGGVDIKSAGAQRQDKQHRALGL